MNKRIRVYDFIWVVFFLAFQIIYFTIPPVGTGGKAAYWLVTLAFAGQYLCAFLALRGTNRKKLFFSKCEGMAGVSRTPTGWWCCAKHSDC